MPPCCGPQARQCTQIAIRGQRLRHGRKLRRRERVMPHIAACHGRRDTRHALLGLQGAHRIDQPAASAEHGDGSPQQPVLRFRQHVHVAWPLDVRHVGMAADGSGGTARGVEQDGVERRGRGPVGGVGQDRLGPQMPTPQVLLKPRHPHGVALDRDNRRTGHGELRCLAARSGTEICHSFVGPRIEQPGRQGGSGVLHPEFSAFEAWQIGNPGSCRETHRTGRQLDTAWGRVPGFRRNVERRLALIGDGDLACLVAPRRPEPGRGVQARSIEVGERRHARLGHAAEHGIDQSREWRQPLCARERDRGHHRGMARRLQQQQPRRSKAQHVAHRFRRRLAQERFEHRVQCSHPAKHRSRQSMRCCTIPWRKSGKRIQRFIERPAAIQHCAQQIERRRTCRVRHQRPVERQDISRPCSRQRASTWSASP